MGATGLYIYSTVYMHMHSHDCSVFSGHRAINTIDTGLRAEERSGSDFAGRNIESITSNENEHRQKCWLSHEGGVERTLGGQRPVM